MQDDKKLPHVFDVLDVCLYCRRTRKELENKPSQGCRKPRFGEGAPGGFGGVTFVNPKLRPEDEH